MAGGALQPGARIGAYTVVGLLGRGGMGAVYRVVDGAGRPFALKVILTEEGANDSQRRRFQREAQAAKIVRHPGVVEVHEVGGERGVPYLVLELVAGGSLKGLLKGGGALGWKKAAALGAEIARALAAIHGAGLVHRDLKPDNVLLDEAGRVKVSDFGLVRGGASSGLSRGALTKTGELVGTLEYMAPEQAETSDVDARADLYALGATLYAMLTGQPPFTGSGVEVIAKHLRIVPRPPRELAPGTPPRLDRLVLALLEKKPADRPPSAEAVARELEAIAKGVAKEGGGSRRLAVALAALLALGAAGGAAFVVKGRGTPAERSAAPPPPPPPPRAAPGRAAKPSSALPARCEAFKRTPRTSLLGVWGVHSRRCLDIPYAGLVFTNDGTRVFSGAGRRVTLWECKTTDEVAVHELDASIPGTLTSIALAADGRRLVAGTSAGEVALLDLESRAWRRLAKHQGQVFCVGFADADSVLSSGEDQCLLSSVATGEARRAFEPAGTRDRGFAIGRDGRAFLGGEDGSVRLVEVANGEMMLKRAGHRGPVNPVALSPDGSRALSGTSGGELFLWKIAPGTTPQRLAGHRGQTFRIAFAGDDRAVTVSDDWTVRVWDLASGADTIVDGLRAVPFVALATSPDGKTAAVGGEDGIIRLVDLEPSPVVRTGPGSDAMVARLGISADGTAAVGGDEDGIARVWAVATGKEAARLDTKTRRSIADVAISKDGGRVLTAGDGEPFLARTRPLPPAVAWDVKTAKEIARRGTEGTRAELVCFGVDESQAFVALLDRRTGRAGIDQWILDDDKATVWTTTRQIAAGLLWQNASTDVTLLTPDGGRAVYSLTGSKTPNMPPMVKGGRALARVKMAPGDEVLFISEDHKVATVTGPGARAPRRLEGHEDDVYAGALSADGALVATTSRDLKVRLWSAPSGELLDTIDISSSFDTPCSAAFEPGGEALLVGTARGVVLRFQLRSR